MPLSLPPQPLWTDEEYHTLRAALNQGRTWPYLGVILSNHSAISTWTHGWRLFMDGDVTGHYWPVFPIADIYREFKDIRLTDAEEGYGLPRREQAKAVLDLFADWLETSRGNDDLYDFCRGGEDSMFNQVANYLPVHHPDWIVYIVIFFTAYSSGRRLQRLASNLSTTHAHFNMFQRENLRMKIVDGQRTIKNRMDDLTEDYPVSNEVPMLKWS